MRNLSAASGSERWMHCPGSVEAARPYPPQQDNKYTLEGTKAHVLFEMMILWLVKHLTLNRFEIPKGYPGSMIDAVFFAWRRKSKSFGSGAQFLVPFEAGTQS